MSPTFTLPGPDGDLIVTGLDCETSGSDLAAGHRLIQAGLAVLVDGRPDIFSSTVGWPLDSWDDTNWSEAAGAVHRISRTTLAHSPTPDEVDLQAESWLLSHGAVPGRRLVLSVGFNVGSFDHPFFGRYLPRTRALVTHRHVDLNSVCFTLDGWSPEGEPRSWLEWKELAKTHAAAELRHYGAAAHDAGYDAAEALLSWRWLRDQISQR
jgi:hypothetical protein